MKLRFDQELLTMEQTNASTTDAPEDLSAEDADRRDFLKKCGRFAALTPPAVTFLLSTTLNSKAIAATSGRVPSGKTRPGWGFGDKNHTHTGPKKK
jgi:hypothetical protein